MTGAAHGIGFEVARVAVERGSAVALLDRDTEGIREAANELAGPRSRVEALPCDVGDAAQVRAAVDAAVERLGPLGGVVTSAGIDRGGLAHELDPGTWDEVIAVNLRGTFLTCRAAIRHLAGAGRGSIVCLSSPLALASTAGSSAYAASKGGVLALVRGLAVDYASFGIRVNAVLPGPTETELMWAKVPPEEIEDMRAVISREIPLGRLADPSEPAQAVHWLLSDQASFVTGSQLACDGGVLAKASVSV